MLWDSTFLVPLSGKFGHKISLQKVPGITLNLLWHWPKLTCSHLNNVHYMFQTLKKTALTPRNVFFVILRNNYSYIRSEHHLFVRKEFKFCIWNEINLTFWTRSFTCNSNKSPTWCNNFSVYNPDVCLQLNMFRAFSLPSSGDQWLQWQPLVFPSYCGDSRAVFVLGPAGRPDHEHSTTITTIRR
jgi:hypothetical protein